MKLFGKSEPEGARKRAPRTAVDKWLRDSLPICNGIIADSGDIMDELQIRELDEVGAQYEQEMQKARAIRKITEEIQAGMRKLAGAMAGEERIAAEKAAAAERAKLAT